MTKVQCIHPLDGRAQLIEWRDKKLILRERCTKCMREDWCLEGVEGVDYPKKFSQSDVEILILSQKKDLLQLRKELKEALIDNMEYNNLLKYDDVNLTIIRTPFKIIDAVFAKYGVE